MQALPQFWIGVAFRRGSYQSIWETFITKTTGGPFVHCEIVVGCGSRMQAFTSLEGVGGFVQSQHCHSWPDWVTVTIPISREMYLRVVGKCKEILALHIPYNWLDLWQCCIHIMLPYERDLDCNKHSSWHSGVFCSQMCLLFLRMMSRDGAFPSKRQLMIRLEGVNSRGCSPNQLYAILQGR